jgi:hypothetical protein
MAIDDYTDNSPLRFYPQQLGLIVQKILAVQRQLNRDINDPVFDRRIVCFDW